MSLTIHIQKLFLKPAVFINNIEVRSGDNSTILEINSSEESKTLNVDKFVTHPDVAGKEITVKVTIDSEISSEITVSPSEPVVEKMIKLSKGEADAGKIKLKITRPENKEVAPVKPVEVAKAAAPVAPIEDRIHALLTKNITELRKDARQARRKKEFETEASLINFLNAMVSSQINQIISLIKLNTID